jgi:hypothetical protein
MSGGLLTHTNRAACGIAFLGVHNRRKKVDQAAGGLLTKDTKPQ